MDDNGRTGLRQVLTPLRAIQSVDILTSDYEDEIERDTGGTINVILKSGPINFTARRMSTTGWRARRPEFLFHQSRQFEGVGNRNTLNHSGPSPFLQRDGFGQTWFETPDQT
jgi:hypothetical protein